jgi:small neutral amino acid transporter SnatA (MarC family)
MLANGKPALVRNRRSYRKETGLTIGPAFLYLCAAVVFSNSIHSTFSVVKRYRLTKLVMGMILASISMEKIVASLKATFSGRSG